MILFTIWVIKLFLGLLVSMIVAAVQIICAGLICMFSLIAAKFWGKHVEIKEQSTDDIWIYTELEAYQHQIKSNRNMYKAYEEEMNTAQLLRKVGEIRKIDKKMADTEAKIAGLEKKVRKLGQKYNIDVDCYL